MSKHDDVLGHYADVFKAWPKQLGAKPSREALAAIHGLGARPGKQALANALAMRPEGVTGSEIVIACGAPQLNKMRGFITDGLVKREALPPRGGHTVYKITLTAKGTARINNLSKAETKAVVKAEAKAERKAVVKKAKKVIEKLKAADLPVTVATVSAVTAATPDTTEPATMPVT